jgi:misacylated tRNA(Ala) deacylase
LETDEKDHTSAKPMKVGSILLPNFSTNRTGIDMKSYDPQMHSAEHILNQTMVRMFGCERSFSSHIEKKKSKCDYHFDRHLTPEEEAALVARINHVINSHLDVNEKLIPLAEAERLFSLKKLPGECGDQIRIISVGEYDHCPCIGPHVRNTDEIGQFQLVSTSFEDGVLRVRFKLNQ